MQNLSSMTLSELQKEIEQVSCEGYMYILAQELLERVKKQNPMTDERLQKIVDQYLDYDISNYDLFEFAKAILRKAQGNE